MWTSIVKKKTDFIMDIVICKYSETCIKRTVAEVPKFISLIYFT